jgi:hypothetical protein
MTWTYSSEGTITITLTSLGTSATLVAGQQSNSIDLSSSNYDDVLFRVTTQSITTPAPTAGGFIEVWWVPQLTNGSWPDGFGATDNARTVSSRAELQAYGKLIGSVQNSAATDHYYYLTGSLIKATCQLHYSKIGCVWVTQSTGQALNGTAANHSAGYMGMTRS